MGLDIAKAIFAAGHQVVATGRDPAQVAAAVGDSADLLVVTTKPSDAVAAVKAAVDRFSVRAGRRIKRYESALALGGDDCSGVSVFGGREDFRADDVLAGGRDHSCQGGRVAGEVIPEKSAQRIMGAAATILKAGVKSSGGTED